MGCAVTKEIKLKKIDIDISDRHVKVLTDNTVTSKYNIKSLLGRGTFSDVYIVEDKSTKLPYAIKWTQLKGIQSLESFITEKKALNNIEHPNIVKFHEVISSATDAYIVMELATGGDLFEQIQAYGNLKEAECCRITTMLVGAIEYLHNHGITHRDLKAENVLYYTPGNNSRVILTDFGFASLRGRDSLLRTFCGTLEYLSPELVLEKSYSNKVDIWALGCLVYFMLAGRLPFTGTGLTFLREKITRTPHSYEGEVWSTISQDAKKFVDICLEKCPDDRSNATDLKIKQVWLDLGIKVPNYKSRRLSYNPVNNCTNKVYNRTHSSRRSSNTSENNRGNNNIKVRSFNFDKLSPIDGNDNVIFVSRTSSINMNEEDNEEQILVDNNILNSCNFITNNNDFNKDSCNGKLLCRRNNQIVPGNNIISTTQTNRKEIVIPNSLNKKITKEDLFAMSSSSGTVTSSSNSEKDYNNITLGNTPKPPISNISNTRDYGSDSNLEPDDVLMDISTKSDNKNEVKAQNETSSVQRTFSRSISHHLPPITPFMSEKRNSLFTIKNISEYNNNSLDKSNTEVDFTQLDRSFSFKYGNNQHRQQARRSRSSSPQHLNPPSTSLLNETSSHKVSSWLTAVREENIAKKCSQAFEPGHPRFCRDCIDSKSLAKSF